MAYDRPNRPYWRRELETGRFGPSAPSSNFNSYETGVPYDRGNHHPSQHHGRHFTHSSASRSLSDTTTGNADYPSQETRALFGREHFYREQEGGSGTNQVPGILSQELQSERVRRGQSSYNEELLYHEPQNTNYPSPGPYSGESLMQDPHSQYDYRERLSSDPIISQGAFQSDRGPPQWENSSGGNLSSIQAGDTWEDRGFNERGFDGRGMHSSDSVSSTSFTGFDSRSRSQRRFSGENQNLGDSLNQDISLGQYGQPLEHGSRHDFLPGHYSSSEGRDFAPQQFVGTTNMDRSRQQVDQGKHKVRRSRNRKRHSANIHPLRSRGRGRGRGSPYGRGSAFVGQGSIPVFQNPHNEATASRGRYKHLPRQRRSSSHGELAFSSKFKTERRDWSLDKRPGDFTNDRGMGKSPFPRMSGHSEVLTRKPLHEPSQSFDYGDIHSYNPKTLLERLGPHIAGSGSVQNRLGPPKGKGGVHSRLGPEETSNAYMGPEECRNTPLATDNVHSYMYMGPEENLSGPLAPDNVHSRLGPEETLGGPLGGHRTPDNVHSRLGPEETLGGPLGGHRTPDNVHSRLGLDETLGGPLAPDNVHSRLGPEETLGGHRTSDNVHSRLGPEETLGGPLAPDNVHSRLGPEETLGGPLAPDNVHSRLGPEETLGGPLAPDNVHSRLGPEETLGGPLAPDNVHSHLGPEENLSGPFVSDSIHSRLGPEESCGRHSAEIFGGHLESDEIHSRLGPEENFDTSLLSGGVKSHQSPDVPFGGPVRPDSSYSHVGMEEVHFRLGPEISSQLPCINTEPKFTGGNNHSYFSDSSQGESHPRILYSSQRRSSLDTHNLCSPTSVSSNFSGTGRRSPHSFASYSAHLPLHGDRPASDLHKSPALHLPRDSSLVSQHSTDLSMISSATTSISSSHKDYTTDSTAPSEGFVRSNVKLNVTSDSLDSSTNIITSRVTRSVKLSLPLKRTVSPSSVTKISLTGRGLPNQTSSKQLLPLKQPLRSPLEESVMVMSNSDTNQSTSSQSKRPSDLRALGEKKSRKVPTATSPVVVQAIPTVEKCKLVSPSTAPVMMTSSLKDPSIHETSGDGYSKKHEDISCSLSTTRDSSAKALGYEDSAAIGASVEKSTAGKLTPTETGVIETSKNTSERDLELTVITAHSDDMCQRQLEDMDIDSDDGDQVNVGVASVVTFERDFEEGEMTDSECGDLVIDLDQSSSSSHPTPKKDLHHERWRSSGSVATAVDLQRIEGHLEANALESTVGSETDLLADQSDITKSGEPQTLQSRSESTVFQDIKSSTYVLGRRGNIVGKACVVLGLPLANALKSALGSWGGLTILDMVHSSSARHCNMLKRLFSRKNKKSNINVDVVIAYTQMKVPECAAGSASITKLAQLVAVNSLVFFHCNLHAFHQHCGDNVQKWRSLSKKYYEQTRGFMTFSQLREFFPTSVYHTTGELLSSLVRVHMEKLCRGHLSYGDIQCYNPGLSFLEVAKLKYGSTFEQVLSEIDKKIYNNVGNYTHCYSVTENYTGTSTVENPRHGLISSSSRPTQISPASQQSLPPSRSSQSSLPFYSSGTQNEWNPEDAWKDSAVFQSSFASNTSSPAQPVSVSLTAITSVTGTTPTVMSTSVSSAGSTSVPLPFFTDSDENSAQTCFTFRTVTSSDSNQHTSTYSATPFTPSLTSTLAEVSSQQCTISSTATTLLKSTSDPNTHAPSLNTSSKPSTAISSDQSVCAGATGVLGDTPPAVSVGTENATFCQPDSNRAALTSHTTAIETNAGVSTSAISHSTVSEPDVVITGTSELPVPAKPVCSRSPANEEMVHQTKQESVEQDVQLKGSSDKQSTMDADKMSNTTNPILSPEGVVMKAGEMSSHVSKSVQDDDNVSVGNVSISSGEIISPSPSPTRGDKISKEGESHDKVGAAGCTEYRRDFSRRSSNWKGHHYFSHSPPPRHRVIPRAYAIRRSRSPPPSGNRWRPNERIWKENRRGGRRDSLPERRRLSRSKSRSISPKSERDRFAKFGWKRSSPEDEASKRRQRRMACDNWVRGRRRETTDSAGGARKGRRDEGKRSRTSRSCDRRAGSESSDEDLEVLQLRKEAIISMLKEETPKPVKEVKKSTADEDEKATDIAPEKMTVCVEVEAQDELSVQSKSDSQKITSATEAKKQSIETESATKDGGPSAQVDEEPRAVERTEVTSDHEQLSTGIVAGTTDVTGPGKVETMEEVNAESQEESKDDKVVETSVVERGLSALPKANTTLTNEEPAKETLAVADAESIKSSPKSSPSRKARRSRTPSPRPPSVHQQQPQVTPTLPITSPPQPKQTPAIPLKTLAKSTPPLHGSKSKASAKKVGSLMGAATPTPTAVLRAASLPSSGPGSRVASPTSSLGSPAPLPPGTEPGGSGLETFTASRRGSSVSHTAVKPSTSVKVVPGSKGTWEIPAFHIQVPESESEEEQSESESESQPETSGVGAKDSHQPPTMDEIDSVLGYFRRDAEAKHKETVIRSPSPTPRPSKAAEGEPMQSSSQIDLGKPEAVGMLPLQQQMEYLELKKKLVLHAKRQREEAIAEKGKEKGKQLLHTPSSKKMKIIRSEQVKPADNLTPAIAPATCSGREMQAQRTEVAEERKSEEVEMRTEEYERKTEEGKRRKEEDEKKREEERKLRAEEQRRKEKKKRWQRKQKKLKMRVVELEGKIRSCRSQTDQWTQTLTSITHEMAECESEMEEHELKIELLRKQLELAQGGRSKCRQRRLELQEKVRVAKEHINRHGNMIQETQRLLIKQKGLLISMDIEGDKNKGEVKQTQCQKVADKDLISTTASNRSDGVDMETVSMEIESDGSKGEGDMEIVTSSGDEEDDRKEAKCETEGTHEPSSLLAPLVYEAISDVEAPGVHSMSGTESDSNVLVPISSSSSPPGYMASDIKSKQRRLSRSKRTRKSSLSVSHTAMGQASDSDSEEPGSCSGKPTTLNRRPSIPTSPPPLPCPPPPPLPQSPCVPTITISQPSSAPATPGEKEQGVVYEQVSPPSSPRPSAPKSSHPPTTTITRPTSSPAAPTKNEQCVVDDTPQPDKDKKLDTEVGTCKSTSDSLEDICHTDREKELDTELKPTSELTFSATLPLPPLEVEFITDTDTASEDGFHCVLPVTTPSVSLHDACPRPGTMITSAATTKPGKSGGVEIFSSISSSSGDETTVGTVGQVSKPIVTAEIHNPFISMLKISKVESLSYSSDASSHFEMDIDTDAETHMVSPPCHVVSHDVKEASHDPGIIHTEAVSPLSNQQTSAHVTTDPSLEIPSHMTSPTCHMVSHDVKEASHDPGITHTEAVSPPSESKESTSLQVTEPTFEVPTDSTPSCSSASTTVQTTEKDGAFEHRNSTQICRDSQPAAIVSEQEQSSKLLLDSVQIPEQTSVSEKVVHRSMKILNPHTRTVYATVVEAEKQNTAVVAGSKGGKKVVGAKKQREAKKPTKKKENVLKAQVGGSKVSKPRQRRSVGKLPLVKSVSDSVVHVVPAVKRSRRKSTPKRYSPKTSPSLPAQTQVLKPCSMGACSPTLNEALQITLQSALSPALASVSSLSVKDLKPQQSRDGEGNKGIPHVSTHGKNLQQKLDSVVSPVLKSLLSPSICCKLLGSVEMTSETNSSSDDGKVASGELVPLVSSDSEVTGKSRDLEVRSHDPKKTSVMSHDPKKTSLMSHDLKKTSLMSHDAAATSLPQGSVSEQMEIGKSDIKDTAVGSTNVVKNIPKTPSPLPKTVPSVTPKAVCVSSDIVTCSSSVTTTRPLSFPLILPSGGVTVGSIITKVTPATPLTVPPTSGLHVPVKMSKVDVLLSQTLKTLTSNLVKLSSPLQSPPVQSSSALLDKPNDTAPTSTSAHHLESVSSEIPDELTSEVSSKVTESLVLLKSSTSSVPLSPIQSSSASVVADTPNKANPVPNDTHHIHVASLSERSPVEASQEISRSVTNSSAVVSKTNTTSVSCGKHDPFLSGPSVPVLGVLPRAVPDIPFEVGSSCLDVHTLRCLVCARFASVSSTSGDEITAEVTGERETDGMETCSMETSRCDGMKGDQSASMEGGREDTSGTKVTNSESMKTSLNAMVPLNRSSKQATTSVSKAAAADTQPCSNSPQSLSSPPVAKRTLTAPHKPSGAVSKRKVSGNRQNSGSAVLSGNRMPDTITVSTQIGGLEPGSATPDSRATVQSPVSSKPSASRSASKTRQNPPSRTTTLSKAKSNQATVHPAPMPNTTPEAGQLTENTMKSTHTARTVLKRASSSTTASTRSSKNKATTVENLLGRIQQVKANLVRQSQATRTTPPTHQVVTSSAVVASAQQTKAKAAAPNVKQLVSAPVCPAQPDGVCQDPVHEAQMDYIVKELGFSVTWKELQNQLQSLNNSVTVPSASDRCGTVSVGQPLLINTVNQVPQTSSGVFVSETALELLHKQSVQTGSGEVTKMSTLKQYKPYSSPLLSMSSYRLNPNYRNNEKLALTSLSYSNKIDPMKIMCKFDMFGKCGNPHCNGQHFRDIKMSTVELVDDIVAYSPSVSTGGTAANSSNKPPEGSVMRGQRSSAPLSDRASYTETLLTAYSGKISDEQLLTLAAHQVSQTRAGSDGVGVVDVEEERIRDGKGGSRTNTEREPDKAMRPPPLYWISEEPVAGDLSDRRHLSAPYPSGQSDRSSKTDRYFTTTPHSSPTSHPPPTPTDPSHFLSLARGAREHEEACQHLESGLALHADSEKLWLEYLQSKYLVLTASGRHGDVEGLLTRALLSCSTYPIIRKCVELAESVTDKQKWIRKGYLTITSQPQATPSLSLCCIELLLSHTHLLCLSGHLHMAVSTLQLSLETEPKTTTKNDHFFTGITSHLSLPHLQLAHLTLLHLLYTSSFPTHLLLTPHMSSTPLQLRHNAESVVLPWSKSCSLSTSTLEKIEQLLAVAIKKCQCQDPNNSMETTFALYQNLILFQLAHRSKEIAHQTLNGLLTCLPHSTQLWLLAAQLQDLTASSATAVDVLQTAKLNGLDSKVHVCQLYCYATKLVMKQGVDDRHGDVLTAALPWLRGCVCQFYNISTSEQLQLQLPDVALLYRKLLGLLVPYDCSTPDPVSSDVVRKSWPHLWVAYCLLVQLSHHTLRGNYHHSDPEDAFESAIHSVNRPSDLQIVWLEYLSYLRENALKSKSSHNAFKAFSDCVYRCLVVMDNKQTTPTWLPEQPLHNHDFSFQDQVCELFFSCLPPTSSFTLSILMRLVKKFPNNPHLIARFSLYCLHHSPSHLEAAQSVLASYLSTNPKSIQLWRVAVRVEQAQKNTREARWMFREAVKHIPLSADLWKEFLLFELGELERSPHTSTQSLSLARNLVSRAAHLGVSLNPHTLPSSPSPCHSSPLSQVLSTAGNNVPLMQSCS